MKYISLLLAATTLAKEQSHLAADLPSEGAGGFSTDLKHSVAFGGNSKLAQMVDTSVSLRSSDPKPTASSWLSDSLLGAGNKDSYRTEFDRRVDAYIKKQKYNAKKQSGGKRLQQIDSIDHDLVVSSLMPMFTGEVRMGSQREILNVVFDTGSDWLVVPSSDCSNCQGNKHDNTVSGIQIDDQDSERIYGSAALLGTTWMDTVCLSSTSATCVENFEYFSFTQQTGINPPIDGIIGMCQNKQMMLVEDEIVIGPLFHDALYDQYKIPQNTFSFAMYGYSTDVSSIVDFGDPAPYRVKGLAITDDNSVTFGFNDDFFWSTSVQAMGFGDTEFKLDGAPYTILDTGSSHLMVPPLLLQPILEAWSEASGGIPDYVVQEGLVFVDCAQQTYMKPLKFMFSEYWVEIAVEDYVWDAMGDGSVCMMLMAANSYDFFLLGQPIYQQYYTIHNTAQSTIKYLPLAGSSAEVPYPGSIPKESFVPSEPPTFVEQYAVLIYLLLCAGIATYVYRPLLQRMFGELTSSQWLIAYTAFTVYCYLLWAYILAPWWGLPALQFTDLLSSIAGGRLTSAHLGLAALTGSVFAYKSGLLTSAPAEQNENAPIAEVQLESQLKQILKDPRAAAELNQYISNSME